MPKPGLRLLLIILVSLFVFFYYFFVDPFMIYVADIADKIYWYVLGFFVLEFFVLLVSNVGFFPLWIVLEYI